MDGDGKLDLITAADGGVAIWRNTTPAAGSLSFADPITYGLGGSSTALAIADIDGDGKPDILTANGSDATLTVMRNTARLGLINDSSLATFQLIPVRSSAWHFAVGDIDGDNKPDIVVTTATGVGILRNQATPGAVTASSFAAEVEFPTGKSPYSVSLGDLDADGRPEIATSTVRQPGHSDIAILKNLTAGPGISSSSFAVKSTTTPTISSNGIAIADVDGDGHPDLAFASDQGVSVLKVAINTQAPVVKSFSPDSSNIGLPVTIRGTRFSGATSVQIGGVPVTSFYTESDSVITAILGNGATGSVSVATPLGTSSLAGFTLISNPSITAFSPMQAGKGDTVTITGTRFNDADTISFGGVAPAWYSVVSDNTIKAVPGSTGASGFVSVKTPFGADTMAGFVYLSYPFVSTFSPVGGATGDSITIQGVNFSTAASVSFGGVPAKGFRIISDYYIRAAVGTGGTGKITVTNSDGSKSLEEFTYIYPAPGVSGISPQSGPVGTTVTITGHGFDPVATNNIVYFGGVKAVVTQGNSNSLTVSVPVGAAYAPVSVTTHQKTVWSALPFDPTFAGGTINGSSFAAPVILAQGVGGGSLALADMDGDGKIDITTTSNSKLSIARNIGASGQPAFAPPVGMTVKNSGGQPYLIDVDGDGRLDMVTGYSDGYPIIAYRNTSTKGNVSCEAGAYWRGQSLDMCFVTPGDFNGDGQPDFGVVSTYAQLLNIMTNGSIASSLNYTNTANYSVDFNPKGILSGDFDRDGKTDVIVLDWYTRKITIYRNTTSSATSTFGARQDIYVAAGVNSITSGDLDGDGKPDLIASTGTNTLTFFQNTSTSSTISFAAGVNYAMTSTPGGMTVGDLDGDGKVDIAAILPSVNNLAILHNTGGAGSIAFADTVLLATDASPSAVAIGDVDGDGRPDLVVDANGNQVAYLNKINSSSSPTLTGYMPASAGQGAVVRISGSHLTGATSVLFGGSPAISFTVVADTAIDATVGAGATGSISVSTPGGTAGRDSFVYVYPAPTVTGFTPATAATGSVITITGTNFDGVTGISFGGTPATSFNIVNSTTITAIVGAAASGNVTASNGRDSASLGGFTYIPPPPAITGSSPASGGPGTVVTITGTGFTGARSVSFGGVSATSFTVVSPTTITATIGNGNTGNIVVTTPLGSSSNAWMVFVAPKPTITSVSPASAPPGSVITIVGTNLNWTNGVTFGGTAADSYTIVSPDTVTAVVGQGTTGWVYVNTSFGSAGSPNQFTLTTPVATLTAYSPNSGTTGSVIAITGTHLSNVSGVSFGGVAASYYIYSDNEVRATVAAGASGNIIVSTPNGPDTLTGFVFNPSAPTLDLIVPMSARAGTLMTLFGSNLQWTTGVTFGGVPATNITVISNTKITVTLGSGASGNVVVTNPGGSGSASGFVYIPPVPVVNSFSPEYGIGGTNLTIKGHYFTGCNFVDIGHWYATNLVVVSDSVITCTVNPYGSYTIGSSTPVQVITTGGTGSLDGFTFGTPPSILPTIASISPASGGKATVVSITGQNFSGVDYVDFGNVPAASFTVVSATQITAVVGQGETGPVTVGTKASGLSGSYYNFLYTGPPPPTGPYLSSVSPSHAAQGATVTIRGKYLDSVTSISFGGVAAAAFHVNSDSSMTVTVGTGSSGSIIVRSPYGADTLYNVFVFDTTAVTPPPTDTTGTKPPPPTDSTGTNPPPPPHFPVLSSFTPSHAPQGGTVTISGSYLDSVTSVSFGSVRAASFTVVSPTQITAIVGTGASGQVKVNTRLGSDSLNGFVFDAPAPPQDTTGTTPPGDTTGTMPPGDTTIVTPPVNPPPPDTTVTPPPPPPPFQLVSFTGNVVANQPVLTWKVKHDSSIINYGVQTGSDTAHLALLAYITANWRDTATYTFTDTSAHSGIHYYRLQVLDLGGSVTYSPVIAVQLAGVPQTLSMYPNPVTGAYITVNLPSIAAPSRFQIVDMTGNIVQQMPVAAGIPQVNIPVGNINRGVYKVIWSDGSNYSYQTVMVLK